MAKHFTKAHIANGYAAMGGSMRRPRYASTTQRNIKDAIAAEHRKAQRMAAASKKK